MSYYRTGFSSFAEFKREANFGSDRLGKEELELLRELAHVAHAADDAALVGVEEEQLHVDLGAVAAEERGAVDWLTLNRPEAMNALSPEMVTELTAYFRGLATRPERRIVVMTGAGKHFCAGLDLKAKGDISDSQAVVWSVNRDTPYVPSPVLHEGLLYVLKSNSGMLTSFDARTGLRHYGPERLPDVRNVYASPVAAAGRLYIVSREGTTAVVRAGQTFEVLSTNTLDDGFDASPAIVEGEIYLRGKQYLYCIAES